MCEYNDDSLGNKKSVHCSVESSPDFFCNKHYLNKNQAEKNGGKPVVALEIDNALQHDHSVPNISTDGVELKQ